MVPRGREKNKNKNATIFGPQQQVYDNMIFSLCSNDNQFLASKKRGSQVPLLQLQLPLQSCWPLTFVVQGKYTQTLWLPCGRGDQFYFFHLLVLLDLLAHESVLSRTMEVGPSSSVMTLNYWMMVERYPNLKEKVGGSIPGCEISSLLDKNLALACRPSVSKKRKESVS